MERDARRSKVLKVRLFVYVLCGTVGVFDLMGMVFCNSARDGSCQLYVMKEMDLWGRIVPYFTELVMKRISLIEQEALRHVDFVVVSLLNRPFDILNFHVGIKESAPIILHTLIGQRHR